MIADMGIEDEFAEFDTTEDEFDRMWSEAEPVEVGPPLSLPHTITVASSPTFGFGATFRSIPMQPAPIVQVARAVAKQ